MKHFEEPVLAVEEILVEDIITASGCVTKLACPVETEEA